MRKILALLLLSTSAVLAGASALAQQRAPLVDVVEIAGLIDGPIERYAMDRLRDAARDRATLLVFQVDSLGGVKVSDAEPLPPLVRAIAASPVPVAVHIGPRSARAGGLVVAMALAAHRSSIGPSARLGPSIPFDVARPTRAGADADALATFGDIPGRPERVYGANASQRAGFVDLVVPSVAELLRRLDGETVTTSAGDRTLRLPSDEVTVRFHQPGPIRRLLHALANPALVYVMLVSAALLLAFEAFQPGFGVAGVTGGLLFLASVFGLTVLPARAPGIALLGLGFGLLYLDVVLDRLGAATAAGTVAVAAGSVLLFPSHEATRIPPWLVGLGVVSSFAMFGPGRTVVRRARRPISSETRAALVGEIGEVRSMLNPEGFVMVDGEIWRARTEDGRRMRVGEHVVVASIDGSLLIVRGGPTGNGAGA